MTNVKDVIVQQTVAILTEKGGQTVPEINDSTVFLTDTDMDSLDLATLIVNLEMHFDYDPFREGFKTFHTLAELVELYRPAAARS